MKVVLHQIRHHLSILWWKILLLYGLEFTFLNFSDNFHCVYQEIHDYPQETDMSFLMLLFFVVPVLLIAFLQLYTWYQKGKVRWQLVMQQHFLQVIADIIVIAGIPVSYTHLDVYKRQISFRNEIIGSTASIITSIYMENQMDIAKDLAGLLLGAILSDTLKLRSPTTTAKDIGIAKTLADKAGLDIDVFAKEMFKVSSNTVSYTHLDVYKRQIFI